MALARNYSRGDKKATKIELAAARLFVLLGLEVQAEVAIGALRVDFLCERTVIEIHGWHHRIPKVRAGDAARTERLQALGYRVVVLWWDAQETWIITLLRSFALPGWRMPERLMSTT